MLQAESDLRCPPQDNEQFFIALRHSAGRSNTSSTRRSRTSTPPGRPDRRIDRMTRMLDWFDRYL